MKIQLVHRRPVAVDPLKTIWTGGKSRSYENRMATAEHENYLRQVFCSGCGVIGGEDLRGRRDMDYDGQLLDFEDIDGCYGEKFSRFA